MGVHPHLHNCVPPLMCACNLFVQVWWNWSRWTTWCCRRCCPCARCWRWCWPVACAAVGGRAPDAANDSGGASAVVAVWASRAAVTTGTVGTISTTITTTSSSNTTTSRGHRHSGRSALRHRPDSTCATSWASGSPAWTACDVRRARGHRQHRQRRRRRRPESCDQTSDPDPTRRTP